MNAGNSKRTRRSEKVRADYRCSGSARGANARIPNCQYGLPMATVDALVLDQVGRLVTALESVDDGVLEQGVAASAPPRDGLGQTDRRL